MTPEKICPEDCPHKQPACEFETIRDKCTARIERTREKIKEVIPIPEFKEWKGFCSGH